LEQTLAWSISSTGQIACQVQASRVLARQERSARGRADRQAAIGACVLDPFGGESIQVGSFVIGPAVATQVEHAEVIGQDQYDVRWAVLSRGIFQTGYTSQDCGDCKHPWFGDDSRSIHGFDSIESGEQQSGPLRGSGVARVGGWVSIVWGDDLQ
jgi:hypothetical protein